MELLKTLKFVRGAISNKVPNEEMKHFLIENGFIRATNGVITLGSPIDLDFTAAPHADTFFHAISNCKDVVSIKKTATGRLSIGSGKFRAFVPCDEEVTGIHPKPTGQLVQFDGQHLLDAFEKLQRFVGKDELRPWTNGILLRGQSAYATNNACLVEYWIGVEMPFIANVPAAAVREVLGAGSPPSGMLMDTGSITFMYEDGRWIKTQLYETEWPPLDHILNAASSQSPVEPDMFVGLKAISKFGDKENRRVYFRDGKLCASQYDEDGATYDVPGLHHEGIYRADVLAMLDTVADTADFTRYPEPVIFYGDRLRGAMLGLTS